MTTDVAGKRKERRSGNERRTHDGSEYARSGGMHAGSIRRVENPMRRSTVAREAEKPCGHEAGGYWAIHYHDQDRPREVFTSEDSAIRRWNQISDSWNADLFIRIRRNYNDQNDI